MAKQYLTRRHVLTREFQCRTEDWHLERCFLARLPSKSRSERDALVSVLVGQNGGHRKKLLATGCFEAAVAFVRLRDVCNATGV